MIRFENEDSPYALTVFWEHLAWAKDGVLEFNIGPKQIRFPISDEEYERVYDKFSAAVVTSVDFRQALGEVIQSGIPITLPQPVGSLGKLTILPGDAWGTVTLRVDVEEPCPTLSISVRAQMLTEKLYGSGTS